MILGVYFNSFLLVAINPSMPSLWTEAAAPDFILIKQQTKLLCTFYVFFLLLRRLKTHAVNR